jgi:Putative peptidoglycan binding domain
MKKVYLLAVAVIVSFALLQSVEAYPRGGGRSFGATPHFSASSYRSSGPSRSYSSGPARHYSAPRVSSMPNHRSYAPGRSRFSPPTSTRNPAYTSNTRRFDGNRTTAFNSRNYPRSNTRLAPGNRTTASRSHGFDRGRVIARYGSNWNRHWNRNHDHFWHGHRCHFHNGFWFIYDPFPFYPYGYGYYPYGGYYDSGYYDDSYAADEYSPASETDQSSYTGDARVSDVQRALAREGYYDGAIDGNLGPATRNALRRYQRDRGLQATGNIDRAVTQALRLR